jgi:hypothetical protein
MTGVLKRRGDKETHGQHHVRMEADWLGACTSQGTPRIASNWEKLGERPGGFSLIPSKRHLDSELVASAPMIIISIVLSH